MTPALFHLPLRLSDAAALAAVFLDQQASALAKPLTDESRARLSARARGIAFKGMTPLLSSLERDPIHPSAWYICVDGVRVDGVEHEPLLLRIAPGSTPSSGLFPKAILIGRTFVGSQEVVLSVVPFGPADHERILTFSEQVNQAFQPKFFGSRQVILIRSDAPAQTFPAAFEGLRKLQRTTGQQAATFGLSPEQDPADFYFATVWAAIRSGWREGFSLHSESPVTPISGVRRRPFETSLTVSRQIVLQKGMAKDDILEQF